MQELLADDELRKRIASVCEIRQSEVSEWPYAHIELGGGPSSPGIAGFEFYPLWLGDWARREAGEINSKLYRALLLKLVPAEDRAVLDAFLQSEKGQLAFSEFCTGHEGPTAKTLAGHFIFGLEGKLRSHLAELEREACCVVEGILRDSCNLGDDISVGRLVKDIAAERRQFLTASIAGPEPQWEHGKSHFERLLPEAAAARKLYRGNRLRDWRGMIKAGYPDFDKDLINALDPDVTAELRDDYSLPANMALEQTARLCGAKPFSLSPRRIRELIDQAPPVVAEPD